MKARVQQALNAFRTPCRFGSVISYVYGAVILVLKGPVTLSRIGPAVYPVAQSPVRQKIYASQECKLFATNIA